MKTETSPRVLLSPLDWGLGHVTRCIPILKVLLQARCIVFVACHETAKKLLAPEFPGVTFLPLRGYGIRYASSKRWFAVKILQQVPKIVSAIWREHRWLKKAVRKYQIDMVISDNRFGLFHTKIPCIFITHQLAIQTPYAWLSRWVQKLSYQFINRFTECWIPDYESKVNIAGNLSHTNQMPCIPVSYIGPLSRFSLQKEEIIYQWLMLLSGPEPQRTLLENELLQIIPFLTGKVMLVRGLPGHSSFLQVPAHCTVFNHLPTAELQKIIAQSEYVISRSGYTIVMEIIAMQKRAILIATPGQTEQEYLAAHLLQQRWCFACEQNQLDTNCLQKSLAFNYQLPKYLTVSLQTIIKDRIDNLLRK